MGMLNLEISYVLWHYGRGVSDLIRVWKDILVFVVNFFSLPQLAATLFAPYRRLGEKSGSGFNPAELLSRLFVNTVMRLLGFVIRLVIITIGLLAVLATVLIAPALLLFWLIAPPLSLILFLLGVGFIALF